MADFELDYETCTSDLQYPVAVSAGEDGTEQRRLITNKRTMVFNLTSPSLTESRAAEYYNFYKSKKGELETFTWRNPDDGQVIRVRFNGNLRTRFSRGFRRINFTFIHEPETEEV